MLYLPISSLFYILHVDLLCASDFENYEGQQCLLNCICYTAYLLFVVARLYFGSNI